MYKSFLIYQLRIKNKLIRLFKIFRYFVKTTLGINNVYSDFALPKFNLFCDVCIDCSDRKVSVNIENIYKRKFMVFPDGGASFLSADYYYHDKFERITKEIDTRRYKLIEWHNDPYSGSKWSKDDFFWSSEFFPAKGSDIKVPRELSRFNHVTLLAYNNTDANCEEFLLEICDWIVHNKLYKGLNWACNMDVALRVINWIVGLNLFNDRIRNFPDILTTIFRSIEDHGNFIYNNLEYYGENHPSENHYLSNIVGLIYIGANFPEMQNSLIWLRFGVQELITEMEKQVNSEGVNYESSMGYHRLVGELFLSASMVIEKLSIERKHQIMALGSHGITRYKDLKELDGNLNNSGLLLPEKFYEKLLKMAEFTFCLTKPNGNVLQYGDNDSGRVHKLDPINDIGPLDHSHFVKSVAHFLNQDVLFKKSNSISKEYLFYGRINGAINLKGSIDYLSGSYVFKESGVAVQKNLNAWLGVICMANGKNGNGGHNHNDKLSFELSVRGEDIVVDGGCPFYTNRPDLRNAYRSTHSHSTVSVEGLEQDEWIDGPSGLFSLKQKSNPRLEVDTNGSIKGSHSGYGVVHERKFNLCRNQLIVEDFLEIKSKKCFVNFNLAKELTVDFKAVGTTVMFEIKSKRKGMLVNLEVSNVTKPILKKGFLSDGYNNPKENIMISCEMLGGPVKSIFSW